jgi:hypothetical protein
MKRTFQPLIFFTALAVVTIAFSGCKREYDTPPERILPVGQILTIQELRDMYQGEALTFSDDDAYSVFGVVTGDEQNGNLYRNIYIQDGEAALNLRLQTPGGMYQGDSVRVYLPGTTLNIFSGMMQLDNVSVIDNVIKQKTGVWVEPTVVQITDITPELQGRLIKLENVEFVGGELGQPFADAINQASVNRNLTNCDGNTIIVRSSGFANFANQIIPEGNGSFVAIVGQFNNDMQLYIRNMDEVLLNNPRCTSGGGGGGGDDDYLFKDFQDQSLTSGGWMNYQVISDPGNHNWTVSDNGSPGNFYAIASGWNNGSSSQTELWLISPPVDLSEANAPGLTFRNARNFSGPALLLMISTDYDGSSDPSQQGTWEDFTLFMSWSTGGFTWTDSGVLPLTNFIGQSNVRIAFRYTSTTQSATWEVDDIRITEY